MRDRYDRTSKWLLQHHGDAVLRLGGIDNVRSCRALHSDLVQPRQLPDGLLEVELAQQPGPALWLVEIGTYPEARLRRQISRDIMIVALDRDELPEVLVLVLHPKGRQAAARSRRMRSRQETTEVRFRWRVIELWKLPAERLLAAGDIGLIPWVPLTQFADSPETVLKECRRRIAEQAPVDERANLLAATQVLAQLRFNDQRLFELLGGRMAMMESPVIQEVLHELAGEMAEERAREMAEERAREMVEEQARESRHRDIVRVLTARFGKVPKHTAAALQAVRDDARLDEVLDCAVTCPDLKTFRARLSPGQGANPKRRGKSKR